MSKELLSTKDSYYDSIRPYIDSEVQEVLPELLEQPEVRGLMNHFFGGISEDQLRQMVQASDSIANFKKIFLKPVVEKIIESSAFSLSISGKRKLDRSGKEKYLFISNHRDIILDSGCLNYLMIEADMPMPRIAIGDNLLIKDWIYKLVRLADAFIVKRKPSMREMLVESKRLSDYIRSSIGTDEASVWLAQSEGRRKNSDDRTQTAVLKMLTMSADKEEELTDVLASLHITPVSITYEYDPCDYLKAKEMLQKRLDPEWTKSQADDLINMQTGLTGQKGRIHFAIGDTIRDFSHSTQDQDKGGKNRQELVEDLAREIDRQIFTNYRFYPNNYVAFDLLHGGQQFAHMYSPKEENTFRTYIEEQIAKVDAQEEHREFILEKLLEMYATPLKNHLITTKQYR
ncbi:MAG: 1-acyl-sn-glycerol-3-phosphate acyltransferase [Porphyromonas sp.]|nr:1-acyl-sn-glycerol-3-phosphate acyltransferase [Porphyromonas sp.]